VVWHHGLTKARVEQLEAVKRSSIRIIFVGGSRMGCPICVALIDANQTYSLACFAVDFGVAECARSEPEAD